MIILVKKQVVILTPPHTASRYLRETLCTQEYDGFFCVGPWAIDHKLDHHSMVIPHEFRDWPTYLIIRNPFTRLIGLWHHYADSGHYDNDKYASNPPGDLPWNQFVYHVIRDNAHSLIPFYRWTLTRLIEPVRAIENLIRFENLQQEMKRILDINIEDRPKIYNLPDYYYNQEIINQIASWAQPDCLRFGYSSNPFT